MCLFCSFHSNQEGPWYWMIRLGSPLTDGWQSEDAYSSICAYQTKLTSAPAVSLSQSWVQSYRISWLWTSWEAIAVSKIKYMMSRESKKNFFFLAFRRMWHNIPIYVTSLTSALGEQGGGEEEESSLPKTFSFRSSGTQPSSTLWHQRRYWNITTTKPKVTCWAVLDTAQIFQHSNKNGMR